MLIESFHSGHRGQRKYCSLHRPATRLVRSTGVVLCHPLGHEYFRAYRSYVKLADQLAQLGFPVLRFDWVGCGDSEGEAVRERLDDWVEDVADAVRELQRSERVSHVALGGLRFGATLSLLAARRIGGVNALLLWEPIVNGARYVQELRRLHAHMLRDLERFARPRRARECADDELVGTRYGERLLHEIAALTPQAVSLERDKDVVLVATPDINSFPRTARTYASTVKNDHGWRDVHRINEIIIDPDAVRHVATSLNTVAA